LFYGGDHRCIFMWPWLYFYVTMVVFLLDYGCLNSPWLLNEPDGQPDSAKIRAWSTMVCDYGQPWSLRWKIHGWPDGVKHIQPWIINHGYQWSAMVTMVEFWQGKYWPQDDQQRTLRTCIILMLWIVNVKIDSLLFYASIL
jgi:hypothetical protein